VPDLSAAGKVRAERGASTNYLTKKEELNGRGELCKACAATLRRLPVGRSTMVVVGRLRGALAPALVIVAMAHTNSSLREQRPRRAAQACGQGGEQERQGREPVQRTADAGREHTCKRRSNS
jgi:hypothetical protein